MKNPFSILLILIVSLSSCIEGNTADQITELKEQIDPSISQAIKVCQNRTITTNRLWEVGSGISGDDLMKLQLDHHSSYLDFANAIAAKYPEERFKWECQKVDDLYLVSFQSTNTGYHWQVDPEHKICLYVNSNQALYDKYLK